MDDIDPKEYCTIRPTFPKISYIVLFFYGDSEKMYVYPIYQIFPNLNNIDESLNKLIENFKDQNGPIEIPEQAVVIPITYESQLPLVRKYWEGDHHHYSYEERVSLFLQMLDKPDFYQLFVIPTTYDSSTKSFELECALPLKMGQGMTQAIENFLQHSDYTVDERAAAVAIYSLGKPMSYNFITKKIDYPEILPKKVKDDKAN